MTSWRTAGALLLVAAAGCADTSRLAMGEVNSIIVVAADSLWNQVEDTVMTRLQPTIFAVRSEPTFQLMHTSPMSEHWLELRRFRQILAIGRPADPWVADALREAGVKVPDVPSLVEADDVWARNQRVTVLVVPEDRPAEAVESMTDTLHALLDRRYQVWARTRMYVSGHDVALADTLRQQAGFTLDMPQVYRWREVGDSAYMFLNDQPDASQLVRSLLVTWRSGTAGDPILGQTLSWRDSVATAFYDWGQETAREPVQATALADGAGDGGLEVRGVWYGTVEDFPQAGPFITRVIDCPRQDRRYLLDAWLYAPARDKYQYMLQLEALLDSFQCTET